MREHPPPYGYDRLSADIDIEILGFWRQDAQIDPSRAGSVGKPAFRKITGGVIVAQDVETAQTLREQDSSEVRRRKARDHGQGRKQGEQRKHGFDAFARRQNVVRLTEPHRMTEEMPQGAACIGQGSFTAAVAGKPGALQAGELAVQGGDGADQSWPALARAAVMLRDAAASVAPLIITRNGLRFTRLIQREPTIP